MMINRPGEKVSGSTFPRGKKYNTIDAAGDEIKISFPTLCIADFFRTTSEAILRVIKRAFFVVDWTFWPLNANYLN